MKWTARAAAYPVHMMYRRTIVLSTCVLVVSCFASGQASARTFGGFECTDDCVGHAGYRWAEENEITDADSCPKNSSDEFYEGCLAYLDDPERGADVDDDGKSIVATTRTSNGTTWPIVVSRRA
jgi:hypothetical protein